MAHIPKPFQRPGVALSDGVKKEWRDVPPSTLKPGDLVTDYGLVESVEAPASAEDLPVIHFASGKSVVFHWDTVKAFVQA